MLCRCSMSGSGPGSKDRSSGPCRSSMTSGTCIGEGTVSMQPHFASLSNSVTVFVVLVLLLHCVQDGATAGMAISCIVRSKRGGPHNGNSECTSPAAGQHAGSGARRRRAPGPPARRAGWLRATARTARPRPPGWRRSRRSRPRWPAGSTGTGPRPPPALQKEKRKSHKYMTDIWLLYITPGSCWLAKGFSLCRGFAHHVPDASMAIKLPSWPLQQETLSRLS